jgi:hypothetical protein
VRGHGAARNRPRRKGRRSARPHVRELEDRSLLSAYLVATTADSGTGSLRDAINQVNADTNHTMYASPGNPNVDEIDFAITAPSDAAGGGTGYNSTTGVATITPSLNLPAITNSVLINGYTQSGATPNTSAQADNAVLKIDLDGTMAGASAVGLDVNAPQCTVSGLDVANWGGLGIWLDEHSSGSTVAGNFVGTDLTGEVAMPNGSGPQALYNAFNAAVMVSSGNNEIGGTAPAARNLISGNNQALGINIQDTYNTYVNPPSIESGNQVQGNLIGTDATGTQSLGNATALTVSPSRVRPPSSAARPRPPATSSPRARGARVRRPRPAAASPSTGAAPR